MKVAVVGCGSGFLPFYLLLLPRPFGSSCKDAIFFSSFSAFVSVAVFDSSGGAGGRMSQRSAKIDIGRSWEMGRRRCSITGCRISLDRSGGVGVGRRGGGGRKPGVWLRDGRRGLAMKSRIFDGLGEEVVTKKYVGMNSMYNELCSGTGVDAKFGTKVAKL